MWLCISMKMGEDGKTFLYNFPYMEKTEWLALWSFKLLSFRCKKNEKCMPFWIRMFDLALGMNMKKKYFFSFFCSSIRLRLKFFFSILAINCRQILCTEIAYYATLFHWPETRTKKKKEKRTENRCSFYRKYGVCMEHCTMSSLFFFSPLCFAFKYSFLLILFRFLFELDNFWSIVFSFLWDIFRAENNFADNLPRWFSSTSMET